MLVGVAWYQREEWPELLAAAADRDDLEQTYDEWLAGAEALLARLAAGGVRAEKVPVSVAELKQGCKARGVPLDASARAEFVSATLLQRGTEHSGTL